MHTAGPRVERGFAVWITGLPASGKSTVAEAVVRELTEETGLEAVCDDLVGWVERIGDGYHFVIFDFLVTVLDGPEKLPQAGADAAEAAWVPLDEVSRLRLSEGLVEFLHEHGIVPVIA